MKVLCLTLSLSRFINSSMDVVSCELTPILPGSKSCLTRDLLYSNWNENGSVELQGQKTEAVHYVR